MKIIRTSNRALLLVGGLLFFFPALVVSAAGEENKSNPPPPAATAPITPTTAVCSPSTAACAAPSAPTVDSPAVQARVRQLIVTIETKPSGIVVNNNGQVAAEPGHSPYNPDGTRNQNYTVTHDNSQGPAGVVLNNDQLRAQAIAELIKIGKPAVPQLVTALMTEGSEFRRFYAYTLGEIKDPRAVPALIKYMEDGYAKFKLVPQIRASGNEALAKKQEDDGKLMIADSVLALEKITGEKYGSDLNKWKQWWEANKAKVGPTPPLQTYTANPPDPVVHYPPPTPTPTPGTPGKNP